MNENFQLKSNLIVIYASGSGNTQKIANGIAEKYQIPIYNILELKPENYPDFWQNCKKNQTILMGSGIFAGKMHVELIKFLKSLETAKIEQKFKFALFCTWLGRGKSADNALDKIETFLKDRGNKVLNSRFKSYGKSFFLHKNHPDESDIEKAKEWAAQFN